eukprot:scaffold9441_cov49-Attheya_sp.AAC.6
MFATNVSLSMGISTTNQKVLPAHTTRSPKLPSSLFQSPQIQWTNIINAWKISNYKINKIVWVTTEEKQEIIKVFADKLLLLLVVELLSNYGREIIIVRQDSGGSSPAPVVVQILAMSSTDVVTPEASSVSSSLVQKKNMHPHPHVQEVVLDKKKVSNADI